MWRRTAVLALIVLMVPGCASIGRSPRPGRFHPPPVAATPRAQPSAASIGIVLSGGGAFGAWEAGALSALFDAWQERHGEAPPVRAVAGTSAGALIAPFVLLGLHDRAVLDELDDLVTGVDTRDIARPRIGTVLPFPLFARFTSSVYGISRLKARGAAALTEDRVRLIASDWPRRRLGVVSVDFASGRASVVTNAPDDIARLRDGTLASAMAPLYFPPVSLAPTAGAAPTPHLDGGIAELAPIATLLDLASTAPEQPLSLIVVIGAFPRYPGSDVQPVQTGAFPAEPGFRAIGDRMAALIAEVALEREVALLRSAIALREHGVAPGEVASITGLRLTGPPPVLLDLRPTRRLGWRLLDFDPAQMNEMFRRGYEETRAALAGNDALR